MSNPITGFTLRCEIEINDFDSPFVQRSTDKTPRIPSGNDIVLQGLLRMDGELPDISTVTELYGVILDAERQHQYGPEITITTPLDATVDEDSWVDGTKQHFTMGIAAAATELAASVSGTEYCLVIYGIADGKSRSFGQTKFIVIRDGVPTGAPILSPNNLVPLAVVYDGSGEYTLTGLVVGKLYMWTDGGANDDSLDNDGTTVDVSNDFFVAADTFVTLNGSVGQPVTALVRAAGNLINIPVSSTTIYDYLWVKNPDDNLYYKCQPRTEQGLVGWSVDETSGTATPP